MGGGCSVNEIKTNFEGPTPIEATGVRFSCRCECTRGAEVFSREIDVCSGREIDIAEIASLPEQQQTNFCPQDDAPAFCADLEDECSSVCEAFELVSIITVRENNPAGSACNAVTCSPAESAPVRRVSNDASCFGECLSKNCVEGEIDFRDQTVEGPSGSTTISVPTEDSVEACTSIELDACNRPPTGGLCRPGPGACADIDQPCNDDLDCCGDATCVGGAVKTCQNTNASAVATVADPPGRRGIVGDGFLADNEFELIGSRVRVFVEDDVFEVPVTGVLSVRGTPFCRQDGRYLLEVTARADDAVFRRTSFEDFRLNLHNVTPFDLDQGHKTFTSGELVATVTGLIEDIPGGRVTSNVGQFEFDLDWQKGEFVLEDGFDLDDGIRVETRLKGVSRNRAPLAIIDGDRHRELECESPDGTAITLDASRSFDPDADDLSTRWYQGRPFGGQVISTDPVHEVSAPLGTNRYSLLVFDPEWEPGYNAVEVTVSDTEPPTIDDLGYGGTTCVWPPNHDYAVLRIQRDFSPVLRDTCDPEPELFFRGASSSQPDNGIGDGNTTNDVVVFPDRVCVRAERTGTEPAGRTYALDVFARDASGNVSDPSIELVVPHDQRPENCRVLDEYETVDKDDPTCDPAAAREEMAALDDYLSPPDEPGVADAPGDGRTTSAAGCATGADPSHLPLGLMLFWFALSVGSRAQRRSR